MKDAYLKEQFARKGRPMRQIFTVLFAILILTITAPYSLGEEAPPPQDDQEYAAPENGDPDGDAPDAEEPAGYEPAPPEQQPATPDDNGEASAPEENGQADQAPPAERPQPPVDVSVEDRVPPEPVTGGVTLNFRDASLDAVLEYLSQAAGFVVVKDADIEGRITVISKQPLEGDEIVSLLNTVLKEKGYMAVKMGRTLKITALVDAKKANVPVRSGNDPEAISASDRIVTQVIPLRYIDAVKLKQDIATLIPPYADLSSNASSNSLILTDTEANIKRIVEIVQALDGHLGTVAEIKVFPLKYADAANAAKLINEVFKQDTKGQQPNAPRWGRDFHGQDQSQTQQSDARLAAQVIASADQRTNTVVVSGPSDVLKIVEGVVKELDANPNAEEAVFVFRLKNAKATNLETILNNLFTNSSNRQNGSNNQQQDRRSFFMRRFGGQVSNDAANTASNLAGQVYFVADEDTNSLMVMTASKNYAQVQMVVEELDQPVPQVLIKVLIAEVTRTKKDDIGVEFSVLNLRPSGNGSSIFSDFGVGAQTDGLILKTVETDVTAALRLLQEVGKLDVLSRPYILASDNQAASITVGSEVPFIQNTRMTETGQTINTIQYEDIGIILNVTPHINPEGLVILDVAPEISTLTGDSVPISETVSAPVFAKRSAESRVAIHDGQTIVIGGMMEDKTTDTIRKVPLLGDIPLLGGLFRRTVKDASKTELLIFLTPHVAKEPTALQSMSDDEMSGSKIIPNAVRPGAFSEHMEGMRLGGRTEQESVGGTEEQPADNASDPRPADKPE